MALNMIVKYRGPVVERPLAGTTVPTVAPTSVASGVPLILGALGPVVSLTASGGHVETVTGAGTLPGGLTSVTRENGGVGNLPGHASFVGDGTFEFAVTGATTATLSDIPVYITNAGALTLTEGSNTLYGITDYPRDFAKAAGRAPVRIGA